MAWGLATREGGNNVLRKGVAHPYRGAQDQQEYLGKRRKKVVTACMCMMGGRVRTRVERGDAAELGRRWVGSSFTRQRRKRAGKKRVEVKGLQA